MSSIPWPFPDPRSLISSIKARAGDRVQSWARKRQGSDPATTRLRPGRVYILPTGVGMIFGLMAFAMLLGSMNYNNNLSFVLTFILVGLGFVSMHQFSVYVDQYIGVAFVLSETVGAVTHVVAYRIFQAQ